MRENMAQKPLIKSLIDAGYKIAKIIPATPMTMSMAELDNGLHVTYERGLMQVGKELSDGTFRFMPIRKSVDEIISDVKAMGCTNNEVIV